MNIGGIDTHMYDQGNGDAVLFLHGWGSDFAVFKPFLDRLAQHRRALALDLPGFGASAPPPAAWDVGDYADFVAAFLRERMASRVVVIGHSFGGRIGIKLASRDNPGLVIDKMILTASAGIRPEKTAAARARQYVYKAVRRILSVPLAQRFFPDALERWRRAHASVDYMNATPLMREVLVKTVNEDLTPRLAAISCPTLLIWGENDEATPAAQAKIMERRIPDAGLALLPGAGHYPFLDQPYAFGLIMDSFLGVEREGTA